MLPYMANNTKVGIVNELYDMIIPKPTYTKKKIQPVEQHNNNMLTKLYALACHLPNHPNIDILKTHPEDYDYCKVPLSIKRVLRKNYNSSTLENNGKRLHQIHTESIRNCINTLIVVLNVD